MKVIPQKYESGLIILYDGWCRFCSGMIAWVSRQKAGKDLIYLPLQDVKKLDWSIDASQLSELSADEICVVKDQAVIKGAKAILLILADMGGWYKFSASLLKVLPNALLSSIYKLVAKHRYRMWGRNKHCYRP